MKINAIKWLKVEAGIRVLEEQIRNTRDLTEEMHERSLLEACKGQGITIDELFKGKSIEETLESSTPVESNFESSDGIPGILGISFPDSSNEIFEKLKTLYDTLSSIGVKEGFINHLNFTDELVYPLISNYIPALLDFEFGLDPKLKGKERSNIIENRRANPIDFYKDIIQVKWTSGESFKHFNSLINLILLNILCLSYNCLSELKESEDFNLKCSFFNLIKLCTGRLDLDIRKQLKRRVVKINKNVMAGFDTEYQNVDIGKVELLSSQLATTGCTEIIIPKLLNYKPHGINPNNGIEYPLSRHPQGLDGKVIERLIDDSVCFIRSKKFHKEDIIVDKFKEFLIDKALADEKEIKEGTKGLGITCIESDKEFLFRTPYYLIKSSVEIVKKLNFELLINKITNSLNEKLDEEISSLNDEFKRSSCFKENTTGDLEFVSNDKFHYSSQAKDNTKGITINLVDPFNFKSLINNEEKISLEMNPSNTSDPSNTSNLTRDFSSIKRKSMKGMNMRITNNVYLFSHYNAADFCFFNDLEKLRDKVFIIDKSFVTIGNRLKVGNWNVNIRDTYLLASAAARSLQKLGTATGVLKVELKSGEINNMRELMIDNPRKFIEYSINDSYITLIHGLFISNFMLTNLHINKVPVSLGSVSKSYCFYKWRESGYKGFQLNPEYLFSDPISNSPKALNIVGSTALNMNLFVATYKGGRNESYMYGLEDKLLHGLDCKESWYDYDLQGCYTTCMSMLGDPDYNNATVVNTKFIEEMKEKDLEEYLLKSYSSMIVDFEFPKSVKYPNIPVQADKNVTIYPLSGEDVAVEGREFLLARKLGCKLKVKQGYHIPYRNIKSFVDGKMLKTLAPGPFKFIKELQQLRKEAKAIWGKGSSMEKMYKDIGNLIYGLISQGITYKKKYDLRTQTHKPISGTELTNPVIASAITAMARCTVSEMMNNTACLNSNNNKILSVTTDGFIANIADLERILIQNSSLDSTFLNMYRNAREDLGHKPSSINSELATEVKTKVCDFISSWATRGQFGSDNTELHSRKSDIVAMTGYQRSGKGSAELKNLVVDSLSSPNKSIHFMQKSLIGARKVIEKGSHVTFEYGERIFRTLYDNRRVIILPEDIQRYYASTNGIKYINYTVEGGLLLETKPHQNVDNARFIRSTMNRMKNPIYQKYNSFKLLPRMNDTADICTRWLCRWFLKYGGSMLLTTDAFIDEILFPLIKNSTAVIRKSKSGNNKYIRYLNSLNFQGSYIPNSVPKNKISEQFLDSLLNYISMLPFISKELLYNTLGNIRNEFFEGIPCLSLIPVSQPIFLEQRKVELERKEFWRRVQERKVEAETKLMSKMIKFFGT